MRRLNVSLIAAMAVALPSLAANAGGPWLIFDQLIRRSSLSCATQGANNLSVTRFILAAHAPLARPEVASGLAAAQVFLRRYQFGLKIWDAYRPVAVQEKLWHASHNSDYVANPEIGVGSLHSWGVAIDATLSIRGIVRCACPVTLAILRPLQCGVTSVLMPMFARTCICCRWQCEMQAFGDCAPSGGISRLLTGKNTCRIRAARTAEVSGTEWQGNYDPSAAVFAFVMSSEVETSLTVVSLKTEIPSPSVGMTKW